jgi:predicted secreted protein
LGGSGGQSAAQPPAVVLSISFPTAVFPSAPPVCRGHLSTTASAKTILSNGFNLLFTLTPIPLGKERAILSLTTAIAIFFILWWTVLFAILPWGIRSQQEAGTVAPGTDPGAPTIAGMGKKLLWTTVVSSVVFAICSVIYSYRIVTLEDLMGLLGLTR